MGTSEFNAGVTLQWTSIPSRGRRNSLDHLIINCNSFGNMTVWQISDLASVNERLQGEQIFWLALRAALTMML